MRRVAASGRGVSFLFWWETPAQWPWAPCQLDFTSLPSLRLESTLSVGLSVFLSITCPVDVFCLFSIAILTDIWNKSLAQIAIMASPQGEDRPDSLSQAPEVSNLEVRSTWSGNLDEPVDLRISLVVSCHHPILESAAHRDLLALSNY